jgi:YspA, cpYpsA-related SLOG family
VRVAIVGSRECGSHIKRTREILAVLRGYPPDTVVISGGAMGIDGLAARAARALGLAVVEYLPDWKTLGRRAGFERNKTIINDCDEVHAWWDGKSRGTARSIGLARKAGKPVTIHDIASSAPTVTKETP